MLYREKCANVKGAYAACPNPGLNCDTGVLDLEVKY